MTKAEQEELLMKIEDCFGLTKYDFKDGKPFYTKWGDEENNIDIADLGDRSLKISKNLGDIYIESIHTNKWVVVGKGTTLHCDDIEAGEAVVENFEGFLM